MKFDVSKVGKVELHLHLDGSVRVKTASRLVGYDVSKEMKYDSSVVSLKDYLSKFDLPISLMQTKENLEKISRELVEDLKKDNVLYAEIRFAPLKHLKSGLSLDEVVCAVLSGLSNENVKTNLILCAMRGDSFEKNKMVIDVAKKYFNKGVCAIDLAGDEGTFKTKDYEDLFNYAKMQDVLFTIHAGEADGVESVTSALDFGTKRLGHGVRAMEDRNVLQRIIDNNVVLEVCPTSNVNTGLFDSILNHNVKKLYDLGVMVTINTDNRTVSNVTLCEEYEKLIDAFDFTKEDFLSMNLYAIDGAFLGKKDKEVLRRKLIDSYKG